MRKGLTVLVAAGLLIVGALVLEAIIVTNFIANIEVIKRTVRETEILQGINAVEFTKRSMQEALPYTIEQTSYDIAKKGGYHSSSESIFLDCIPFWRDYAKTYYPDVEGNLSDAILDLFNCYGKNYQSGYSNVPIYVPDYKGCGDAEIESSNDLIKASVFTDRCSKRESSLGAIKHNLYDIQDNANFTDTVRIYTLGLFDIGKELFIQKDSVLDAVEYAEDRMVDVNGKNCKEISVGSVCENEMVEPENVLNQVCPNAEKKFEDLIKSKILELEGNYDGKIVDIDIVEINVTNVGQCIGDINGESTGCDCKRGHQECPPDADINNGTHCLKCSPITAAAEHSSSIDKNQIWFDGMTITNTPLSFAAEKCCCDHPSCLADGCCWAETCPSSNPYSCPTHKCTGEPLCPTTTTINTPPIASFTKSASTIEVGKFIYFDALGSYDPDGVIVNYAWDFGDGETGVGIVVDHVYSTSGTFTVTLTVKDDDGATNSATDTVTVMTIDTTTTTLGRSCCPHISYSCPSSVSVREDFQCTQHYTHDNEGYGGVNFHWLSNMADNSTPISGCDPGTDIMVCLDVNGNECTCGTPNCYKVIECNVNDGDTVVLTLKATKTGTLNVYHRAWDWTEDRDCGDRMDYDRDPDSGTCSNDCKDFPNTDVIMCDKYTTPVNVGLCSGSISVSNDELTCGDNHFTVTVTNTGPDELTIDVADEVWNDVDCDNIRDNYMTGKYWSDIFILPGQSIDLSWSTDQLNDPSMCYIHSIWYCSKPFDSSNPCWKYSDVCYEEANAGNIAVEWNTEEFKCEQLECEDAWEWVCDEYYKIVNDVECTYNYYGDAIVLVKIYGNPADNNNKYPVFDEDLDWRVITLKFHVVSGNLMETKPKFTTCPFKSYC